MITEQQFREELKLMAFRLGSQKKFAEQLGISPQQLSFAITGKRPPCDAILEGTGYEMIVMRRFRKLTPKYLERPNAPAPQA